MYKMYIKNLEIYFTTDAPPLKAAGKEAQKIFDRELPNLDEVIELTINGKLYSIPRTSILYVETIPHEEANALEDHIHETFVELKEQIRETHKPTYKDSYGDDIPMRYYFSDLEYWNFEFKEDGGLDVGVDEFENDVIIYDQEIIAQFKDLIHLQRQLDAMVGGRNDK